VGRRKEAGSNCDGPAAKTSRGGLRALQPGERRRRDSWGFIARQVCRLSFIEKAIPTSIHLKAHRREVMGARRRSGSGADFQSKVGGGVQEVAGSTQTTRRCGEAGPGRQGKRVLVVPMRLS